MTKPLSSCVLRSENLESNIPNLNRPPNSCMDLFDKLQVILDKNHKIEYLGMEKTVSWSCW